MAKRRRGKYRMTPRRRAALKKAQNASARKRRGQGLRNGLKTTAKVVGYASTVTAIGIAGYGINNESKKFAKNPEKYVRDVKSYVGTKFGRSSGVKAPVKRSVSPDPSLRLNGMPWVRKRR